jgi:hypothetical protein
MRRIFRCREKISRAARVRVRLASLRAKEMEMERKMQVTRSRIVCGGSIPRICVRRVCWPLKSQPKSPTTSTHPPSDPPPPQTHHHGSGKHATPPLSLDAGEEVAQRLLHVAALRSPHLVHFNTAGHSADRDHPTPSSSTSSAFSSSSSRPHLADDDSFEGDRTLTHIRKLSFGSFPP